jgi:hypothetical protein
VTQWVEIEKIAICCRPRGGHDLVANAADVDPAEKVNRAAVPPGSQFFHALSL